MTTVMNLTLKIPTIATNPDLKFEEKTEQIRELLLSHRAKAGTDANGHVLQNISRGEFTSAEGFNRYMRDRGKLLINAEGRCGWTILMAVARTNAVDIARWLVQTQGARVDISNEFGVTPLHAAVQEGQEEMANCLIELGANVNQVVKNDAADSSHGNIWPGLTPLHFAVRYGKLNLVNLLLTKGADITLCCGCERTALQWAREIRLQLEAMARGEENIKIAHYFGPLQYRDQSKVPSIAVIDEIIRALSTPSEIYMNSLRISKANPRDLVSQANEKDQRRFESLLTVVNKATAELPDGPQNIISTFLFSRPGAPIDLELIQNHLAEMPANIKKQQRGVTADKEFLVRARHFSEERQKEYDRRYGLIVASCAPALTMQSQPSLQHLSNDSVDEKLESTIQTKQECIGWNRYRMFRYPSMVVRAERNYLHELGENPDYENLFRNILRMLLGLTSVCVTMVVAIVSSVIGAIIDTVSAVIKGFESCGRGRPMSLGSAA